MEYMNSIKKCNGTMNSNKNKLNSKIIFIFYWYLRGGISLLKVKMVFLFWVKSVLFIMTWRLIYQIKLKTSTKKKKKGKLGDQSRKLNLESYLEHTSCTLRIKLKDESKTFKQMKCPKNTCSFFFCHVSEFDLH